MTNLVLTVIVGAFVAAFAIEVMTPKKRDGRSWLSKAASDFKRGFLEGYRGKQAGNAQLPEPAPAA